MKRLREPLFCSMLAVTAFHGCASLDARPDYEEVSKLVAQATGHPELHLPGGDDDVCAEVTRLLGDGLTADEAVTVSLLNSPKLQALLLDVGISRAELSQASFLRNPSLAMTVRFPSVGGTPNLEASLAENIADLWRLPIRRRAAEASLKRVVFEVAREVSGIAYDAKAAYVRAVAADRMKAIASENRDIAARFLDVTLDRRKGGEGSGIEVGFARSEVSSAEVAFHSASLASFERRAELARRLGLLTHPGELVLTDSLPRPDEAPPNLEAVLSTIASDRLDIQAAWRAVESARATLTYERLGLLSLFELGAAYERPERRSGEDGDSSDYLLGPSLGLELPLFDQNRAQIAKARLAHRQAEKLLNGLVIDATQETRAAYERVVSSLTVARLYEAEILPERENDMQLVRDTYGAGELPVSSMLEAQRSLLGARVELVKVLEASALAFIDFERVTGRVASR
jgi:outer membrane protein, heavy metal efflux system